MLLFKKLGKALRLIRNRRGWTQSQWAEKVGIDKATISKYELDQMEMRIGVLDRLLVAAGADLEELSETLLKLNNGSPSIPPPFPDLSSDPKEWASMSAEDQRILEDLAKYLRKVRDEKD